MSRRAKLIIAAIFLVLLGISVTHLVLTWAPHEPLRFRLVGQEMKKTWDGKLLPHLTFEIENVSPAPIFINQAELMKISGEPLGEIQVEMRRATAPGGFLPIPSYTVWRYQAVLTEPNAVCIRAGNGRVRYRWISETRNSAHPILDRLRNLVSSYKTSTVVPPMANVDMADIELVGK